MITVAGALWFAGVASWPYDEENKQLQGTWEENEDNKKILVVLITYMYMYYVDYNEKWCLNFDM